MWFDMGNVVTKSLFVDFGIQWGLWILASALKTEKFYDLAGSGTFFYLAYQSLQWGEKFFMRQKIQTGMVMIWAMRLGLYLFSRVLHDGFDRRFNKARNSPSTFLIFWTIQGVWVFLTLLPTLIQNSKQTDTQISTRDYVGWGMWTAGFLIEVISDYQKSQFRANPDNAGKFITSGLWSLSRHPNYFGEILLWTGLYLTSTSVLRGWEHFGVLSPLLTATLLTKVSGIPMLEKSGLKRWGTDPAYQQYLKNTPVLIPFLY